MLEVMFVELLAAAESGTGGEKQEPEQQEADELCGVPGHQTITSFCRQGFGLRHAEPVLRAMLWNCPFALDRQAKPLEYCLDVFFAEARGIEFHQQPVERWCQLHAFNSVPTVDIADAIGILVCQRPNEVVFKLNLCHSES
jgi:hypothetical protein